MKVKNASNNDLVLPQRILQYPALCCVLKWAKLHSQNTIKNQDLQYESNITAHCFVTVSTPHPQPPCNYCPITTFLNRVSVEPVKGAE